MLSSQEAYPILQKALQRLGSCRDWDRLQSELGGLVLEIIPADGAAVIVRGVGEHPHLMVRLVLPDEEERTFRVQAEANTAAWVLEQGEPAYVEDVYLDDRYGDEFPHGLGVDPRTVLAVPLIARGETFGVLEALREEASGFTRDDLEQLTCLADWAASMAAYALELWHARQQVEELETLIHAATQVGSSLELESVLLTIIQLAQQVSRAEASSLLLPDPDTGELIFYVALGEKGEEVKQFRLQPGEGIAGWVVEHGEPLLVPDVTAESRFRRDIAEEIHFPTRSILCVPLKVDERTIGAVEVINSIGRDSFDEHDLRRLTMLSQQAVLAIQNAQQFETLRRNLARVQDRT